MSTWAQRARAHFLQERQNSTTETTESPLLTVLTVQSGRFCEKHDFQNPTESAANDPAPDSDRWCWPHSTAMTGREIDTFTARLARFTTKGVIHAEAELLADKLVTRDRESDDRRLCLECAHLRYGWRCGNWEQAGVAIKAQDAQLPVGLVQLLQRCDGFIQSIHFQGGNNGQA